MSFFTTLFKSALKALIGHFQILFLELDPVKEASISRNQLLYQFRHSGALQEPPSRQLNRGYLCPIFLMLFICLDSLYIFSLNNFQYSYNSMPELFLHQAMPAPIWQLSDMMMITGITNILAIYSLLLVDPKLNQKFIMYLFCDKKTGSAEIIQNGKVLHREEALKIHLYAKKVRAVFPIGIIGTILFGEVFLCGNVLQNWINSVHSYIMLAVTIAFAFYAVISNVILIYYFCITSRYIHIKQNCKMRRFQKLSTVLNGKLANKTKYRINQNKYLWAEFRRINREITALYEEIRGHDTFWCKYLTCYYIFITVETCYLVFVLLFANSLVGLPRLTFIFFAVQLVLLLTYVTWQCSVIVYNNCKAHRQGQQMAIQMRQIYRFTLGDIFKVDSMAANYKNIGEISFKLATGYEINSKMFQMMYTYSSLLFMMVFKNQKRID